MICEDDSDESAVVMFIPHRALDDADVGELLEFEFVPHRVVDEVFKVDRLIPVVLQTVVIRQPLVIPELDLAVVRVDERHARIADPPVFLEYLYGHWLQGFLTLEELHIVQTWLVQELADRLDSLPEVGEDQPHARAILCDMADYPAHNERYSHMVEV